MATLASPLIPLPPPGRPPGARRGFLWRWGRRVLAVVAAVLAALVISFLTIDLGRIPGLKGAAERAATNWLDRPMHIGKIEVRPGRGEYVISDLVIDGLPGERAFFTAKTILVRMSWQTVLQRQLVFDIRVHGWQMLIEKWSDPDRHNIPRLMGPQDPNKRKTKGAFTFRTASYADDGAFIYEDHGTPWSITAPNLSFSMVWSLLDRKYVGLASFAKGTVRIQDFLPMSAEMSTRFQLDGSDVTLPHIDLKTDGADTHVTGHLNFSKWPEQSYTLNSTIDFARMREIFFAKETWTVQGTGRFAGVFNIYKDDPRGRDLTGDFTSDLATVESIRFPNLHGSLEWLRDRFAVTHADADFYGGTTRFAYAIEPIGTPGGATQKFAADLERVDLRTLRQVMDLPGLDLEGRARGRIGMAWPSGHLHEGVAGSGELSVTPPDGVELAAAVLPARGTTTRATAVAEFSPKTPLGPLPVGGDLAFRFDPGGVTFRDSTVATPSTFIALRGRRDGDGQAHFPFHVTSLDWQASDRLLAAIMTAMHKPTDPVEVGGVGTFDGVMTETFDAPRIQGHFTADDMSAWKVVWGHGDGDVVMQDRYLDVSNGVIARDGGEIRAHGRFALGFPRADGKDEIKAEVAVRSWPLNDLRVAFGQTEWPVDGLIASSDLELHGLYSRNGLYGGGKLRLERGRAWTETFDTATGDLSFDGASVALSRVNIAKGPGVLTGTAVLGWDGTYSFDVAGQRIAVESLDFFRMDRAPLSGVMALTCSGQGEFSRPRYQCKADTPDLSAGDQGIGNTHAEIALEDGMLTILHLDVDSQRLRIFSNGQIALNDRYDTIFTARFEDASIDPYLKFITPKNKWSDFVKAVVFGKATATGPLKDIGAMQLDATIDHGTLSLWDYELNNPEPITFTVRDRKLAIGRFGLKGTQTNVALFGSLSMADSTADLRVAGDVNLEILNGLGRTSEGTAKLDASIRGPFDGPIMSGTAEIKDGKFRYGTLPSLAGITGTLTFDAKGINANDLHATMGGGDVKFGGNVSVRLDEYRFDTYDLTATGTRMRVRYPEGFVSTVNATLSLTGPVVSPLLSGDVTVLSADYVKQIDPDTVALLGLAAAAGGAGGPGEPVGLVPAGQALTYDINIHAPPTSLRIDNKAGTRIEAGGELQYSGPADRPSLIGTVDITSGGVSWNGNRYTIRSGSIDFTNPSRIDPYFNIVAFVRPRAPGQTYDVTIGLTGTTSKLVPTMTADPWLSQFDIIRLLLGDSPGTGSAEQRALHSSQELPGLLQSAGAQMLAAPLISKPLGLLGAIPGAPTVNIAPVLNGELNSTATTARVTVGSQISSKAYIYYVRTLNGPQNEFVQLEVEQNEHLSWILSRNEDRTFALEFRLRYIR